MSHKPQPHLLLHNIIGALSYWGTTTRLLLVGFVLSILVLAHIIEASSASLTVDFARSFFLIMGSLLLLDAGYVTIAKAKPLAHAALDKLFLWSTITVLSVVAIAPYIVEVKASVYQDIAVWLIAVILFVLALRLVMGMIAPTKER